MNPSESESAPAKPGMMQRIASAAGRLSVAGCASIVLALFLFTMVVVVWVVFFTDPAHVPWRHSMTWPRILTVILLALVIPFVFYKAVKLWLEGESSRFPSIDVAWHAGIKALGEHGLSIQSAPVFVILGSPGEEIERAIMQATGSRMRVRGVPEGPSPLHWYASAEAIYLVCSDASWLSALNAIVNKQTTDRGFGEAAAGHSPAESQVAE